MKITLLGTGTSCGVPVLGCKCKVCKSTNPHDRRLRCAALLETETTRLLIDCGPDIRQQLMSLPFRRIDGVLLTHMHYDHVGGIDDLRPYCYFGTIPLYGDKKTLRHVRESMPYCFPHGVAQWIENALPWLDLKLYPGVPSLSLNRIKEHVPFSVGDIDVLPVKVMHGKMPILGFRIGSDFAYITDMKSMPPSEMELLRGVRVLVVNALRFEKPHHSHQLVADAVKFARELGAEQTWLIHFNHDIGLETEAASRLPNDVKLAYDGLVLDI